LVHSESHDSNICLAKTSEVVRGKQTFLWKRKIKKAIFSRLCTNTLTTCR